MAIAKPFNLKKWIDDNRHFLKPPVGNKQVYLENEDYIVMVVGGPNGRKDYHFEDGEELFYQLEGDITLKIINEDGKPEDIQIREGDITITEYDEVVIIVPPAEVFVATLDNQGTYVWNQEALCYDH